MASTVNFTGSVDHDLPEHLFLLMAQAHLPMPRLPDAATRQMVDRLKSLPQS